TLLLQPVGEDQANALVIGRLQHGAEEGDLFRRARQRRGRRRRRRRLPAVDGVVDLLAMDGNVSGTDDPQADLVAAYLDDGEGDVAVDDDAFPARPIQDEHGRSSMNGSVPWNIVPRIRP